MNIDYAKLRSVVVDQPYSLIFATISGAHLYGFPSPDSDFDLRGVHVLPLRDIVGLETGEETVEISEQKDGLELDLVSHDVKKFFTMLLKRNGYVLEQLYSPLIVHTTPEHEELKNIAQGCITRHHVHHYLGFAKTEWSLFVKENPRRVKPLLYVYRVLLTGIYLMQTGKIEANLLHLNELFKLSFVDELVAYKLNSAERSILTDANLNFYESEYERLTRQLEEASQVSLLPELPTQRDALNDLLIRIRISSVQAPS
jgi:uncharacterized protein